MTPPQPDPSRAAFEDAVRGCRSYQLLWNGYGYADESSQDAWEVWLVAEKHFTEAAHEHARAEMEAEIARLRESLKEVVEAAEDHPYGYISGSSSYGLAKDQFEMAVAAARATLAEPQPTPLTQGRFHE